MIVQTAVYVDNRDARLPLKSFTRLPVIDVTAKIKRRIGKPDFTSKKSCGWATAGHAGLAELTPFHYGHLVEGPLPV